MIRNQIPQIKTYSVNSWYNVLCRIAACSSGASKVWCSERRKLIQFSSPLVSKAIPFKIIQPKFTKFKDSSIYRLEMDKCAQIDMIVMTFVVTLFDKRILRLLLLIAYCELYLKLRELRR